MLMPAPPFSSSCSPPAPFLAPSASFPTPACGLQPVGIRYGLCLSAWLLPFREKGLGVWECCSSGKPGAAWRPFSVSPSLRLATFSEVEKASAFLGHCSEEGKQSRGEAWGEAWGAGGVGDPQGTEGGLSPLHPICSTQTSHGCLRRPGPGWVVLFLWAHYVLLSNRGRHTVCWLNVI